MADDDAVEGAPDGPEGQQFQIIIDQAQMAGVWANFARVSHSEHEFTLDFVRLDYQSGQGTWYRASQCPRCSLRS